MAASPPVLPTGKDRGWRRNGSAAGGHRETQPVGQEKTLMKVKTEADSRTHRQAAINL